MVLKLKNKEAKIIIILLGIATIFIYHTLPQFQPIDMTALFHLIIGITIVGVLCIVIMPTD